MGLVFNGNGIEKITIDTKDNSVVIDSKTKIDGLPDDGVVKMDSRAMDGLASYVFRKVMEYHDDEEIERIINEAIEACDPLLDNAIVAMFKDLEKKVSENLSEPAITRLTDAIHHATVEYCRSIVISHIIYTAHITLISLGTDTITLTQRKVDSVVSTKILNAKFKKTFSVNKEDNKND